MADGPESAETGRTLLVAAVVLLGFEVVLGVVGGLVVLRAREHVARPRLVMAPRVVATQRLAAGTVLRAELLQVFPVPEQFVSESMVQPEELPVVLGEVLAAPLAAGETLRWGDLARLRDPALCQRPATATATLPASAWHAWAAAAAPDGGARE